MIRGQQGGKLNQQVNKQLCKKQIPLMSMTNCRFQKQKKKKKKNDLSFILKNLQFNEFHNNCSKTLIF